MSTRTVTPTGITRSDPMKTKLLRIAGGALLALALARLTSQAVVLSGSLPMIRFGDVLGIVSESTWGRG